MLRVMGERTSAWLGLLLVLRRRERGAWRNGLGVWLSWLRWLISVLWSIKMSLMQRRSSAELQQLMKNRPFVLAQVSFEPRKRIHISYLRYIAWRRVSTSSPLLRLRRKTNHVRLVNSVVFDRVFSIISADSQQRGDYELGYYSRFIPSIFHQIMHGSMSQQNRLEDILEEILQETRPT